MFKSSMILTVTQASVPKYTVQVTFSIAGIATPIGHAAHECPAEG